MSTAQPPNSLPTSFDLDALLHPAGAFAHPMEVVHDRDLTLSEKRAILASWASDACAVEAAPELRSAPGGELVRWNDIMDALRLLDARPSSSALSSRAQWHQWRRWRQPSAGDPGSGARSG